MKKSVAAALILAAGLRIATLTGLGDKLETWLGSDSDSRLPFSAALSLEVGDSDFSGSVSAVTASSHEAAVPAVSSYSPAVTPTPYVPSEEIPEPVEKPTVLTAKFTSSLKIDNDTNFDIDAAALLNEPLELTLPSEGPQILIIHTHGSEAYTQDSADRYVETDPTRTDDTNYNVVRVGDVLEASLENFGLNVIHDRDLYDYPSYTGSYSRSGAAVESYLEQYPDIAIVIDLHRDALGSGDVIYKTIASIEGTRSSQVMLLIGTGENGLAHPYWKENLKLALRMQDAMDSKYPTLARPVDIVSERYNQHLTTGSMILEVGSNGNTLQEAICAVRLFADAVGPMLSDLVQ